VTGSESRYGQGGRAGGTRQLIVPRRSAASLRDARNPAGPRSIAVAFAANVVVTAAKLVAGLMTGSAAMLAEAVHSAADSCNEILLFVSLRRARKPADVQHPFGYGGARFLWAFLAAITSFVIGGCVSIALAIRDLIQGSAVETLLIAWIVLAVAALADGTSLAQGLRQAQREAARWNRSTIAYLRSTSDPTLRAIVVEDAAAVTGVGIAAAGLLVTALGGPASADAIASLLIGILLAVTAVGLARPLADLLIGESISPDRLRKAREILMSDPGVEEVLSVYGVHAGPHEAILAAKIHPAGGLTADELAVRLDALDQQLRKELVEIGEVFIDATAHHARGEETANG
jgi:cation diffusion facilitator family transporter